MGNENSHFNNNHRSFFHLKSNEEKEKKRLCERDYQKVKIIGKGSFGKTVLVVRKQTSKLYVMKILEKKMIVKREKDCIKTTSAERFLLAGIQHPFCVYLHATFSNRKKLFLILDYVNGGDLEFILKKKKRFSKEMVRFYTSEVILALQYLHENHILHRGIKLSNILLSREGHIRVTDFGLDQFFENKDFLPKQVCGYIEYISPKVIRNMGKPFDRREEYDDCVDFWSLGIIIFEMVYGHTPFAARTVKEIFQGTLHSEVEFPSKPKWVGRELKDLIRLLLEKDSTKRLGVKGGVESIIKHAFFEEVDWEEMKLKLVKPPYIPKIKDELHRSCFDEDEKKNSEQREAMLRFGQNAQKDPEVSGVRFCNSLRSKVVSTKYRNITVKKEGQNYEVNVKFWFFPKSFFEVLPDLPRLKYQNLGPLPLSFTIIVNDENKSVKTWIRFEEPIPFHVNVIQKNGEVEGNLPGSFNIFPNSLKNVRKLSDIVARLIKEVKEKITENWIDILPQVDSDPNLKKFFLNDKKKYLASQVEWYERTVGQMNVSCSIDFVFKDPYFGIEFQTLKRELRFSYFHQKIDVYGCEDSDKEDYSLPISKIGKKLLNTIPFGDIVSVDPDRTENRDIWSFPNEYKEWLTYRRFNEHDFEIIKVLGEGGFGRVSLVRRLDNNKLYAMKTISKKEIVRQGKECVDLIRDERLNLAAIQHPFCIYLRATFCNPRTLFFIFDYLPGGDIKSLIQKGVCKKEENARFYVAEVLLALDYLHGENILHRDLTPSNILLNREGHIRVSDFGMSKYFKMSDDELPKQVCGTVEYLSPEVVKNIEIPPDERETYDRCVDFWSVGIILYEMLCLETPFSSKTVQEVLDGILHSEIPFPPSVSPTAKDLISKLLEKEKEKRLGSSEEVMKHPFFDGIDWNLLYKKKVKPPYIPPNPLIDLLKEKEEKAKEGTLDGSVGVDHDVFGTFGFNREDAMDASILKEVPESLKEMVRKKVERDVKEESIQVNLDTEVFRRKLGDKKYKPKDENTCFDVLLRCAKDVGGYVGIGKYEWKPVGQEEVEVLLEFREWLNEYRKIFEEKLTVTVSETKVIEKEEPLGTEKLMVEKNWKSFFPTEVAVPPRQERIGASAINLGSLKTMKEGI